ncbi:glycosyltransferase family 4 protein [Acaryochloris marina NIES-2412]|uniref:glycosyltransferase family 4 protein n=1 Tax=Acaryochloris marina TaxID=155978 RepID=UPI004059C67B
MSNPVVQICIGRFHHFHLARQLERANLLLSLYTGYPRFKLSDEEGIPQKKICTFPWIQTPYIVRGRIKLDKWDWLNREWAWQAHQTLDLYVSQHIKEYTTLVALSGSGLISGLKAQRLGGYYICDRGSSHIRYQDEILREEHIRWNIPYKGIDPRVIDKEEAEYETANYITVPSEFVRQSFIKQGVSPDKVRKISYGARLDRFHPISKPNPDEFRILFVGSVSLRKGFLDVLQAFNDFDHPAKKLIVIGSVSSSISPFIEKYSTDQVEFLGIIPNKQLARYFSESHVFVLPSIEEGLAMVLGEALACGCPVIATENTGASDLIRNGHEGFIVPIRQPQTITDKLELLSDCPELQKKLSKNALKRVKQLGGWDNYGDQWYRLLQTI